MTENLIGYHSPDRLRETTLIPHWAIVSRQHCGRMHGFPPTWWETGLLPTSIVGKCTASRQHGGKPTIPAFYLSHWPGLSFDPQACRWCHRAFQLEAKQVIPLECRSDLGVS